MSFKQTIKQLASQQKMTVEFLNLTKDLWFDLYSEWLGENTSESFGDYLVQEKHYNMFFFLFMNQVETDYNRLALELESEGVVFYDHLSDKEPRQCAG